MPSRYNKSYMDLFGRYCLIASGTRRRKCLYRIIDSGLKSRLWSDVPLSYESVYRPERHDEVEDVIFVVRDDNICELTRIVGVRLKDVELIHYE